MHTCGKAFRRIRAQRVYTYNLHAETHVSCLPGIKNLLFLIVDPSTLLQQLNAQVDGAVAEYVSSGYAAVTLSFWINLHGEVQEMK